MNEVAASIDDKLENVIAKLRVRARTHPQLCRVWREYLAIKREKLETAMDTCMDMIDKTSDSSSGDISVDQMWFLSNMGDMVYRNTT